MLRYGKKNPDRANQMRFDLVGDPVAQKRARFFMKGNIPTGFDPSKPDKRFVQWKMKKHLKNALNSKNKPEAIEASELATAKSFKVVLLFWFSMPESWSKKKKNEMVNRFHVSKPDVDNLIKFYLDCATNIIWSDDRLVSEIVAVKRYGLKSCVTMIVTAQTQESNTDLTDAESAYEKPCFDSDTTCGYEQLHLFGESDPL